MIVNQADYEKLYRGVDPSDPGLRSLLTQDAVRLDDAVAVLLPGPYSHCAASIRAAGGRAVWPVRTGDTNR